MTVHLKHMIYTQRMDAIRTNGRTTERRYIVYSVQHVPVHVPDLQ